MSAILVGAELSSEAQPAVECGLALGKQLGVPVAVLHVHTEPLDAEARRILAEAVGNWSDAGGYPATMSHRVTKTRR